MLQPNKYFIQKGANPAISIGETFGIYIKRVGAINTFGGLKKPYSFDWIDEQGMDSFFTGADAKFEHGEVEIEFAFIGETPNYRDKVREFIHYITSPYDYFNYFDFVRNTGSRLYLTSEQVSFTFIQGKSYAETFVLKFKVDNSLAYGKPLSINGYSGVADSDMLIYLSDGTRISLEKGQQFSIDGIISVNQPAFMVIVPKSVSTLSVDAMDLDEIPSVDSDEDIVDLLAVEQIGSVRRVVTVSLDLLTKGDKGDPFLFEDFTPEQIAELQRPATDAATQANNAAQAATQATQAANEATVAASTASESANTAANRANTASDQVESKLTEVDSTMTTIGTEWTVMNNHLEEKIVEANTAINVANTASNKAELATTEANTARDSANQAATNANTAKDNAIQATQNAAQATTEANTARDGAIQATTAANTAKDSANLAAQKATEATSKAETATTNANNATSNATSAASAANTAKDNANDAADDARLVISGLDQRFNEKQKALIAGAGINLDSLGNISADQGVFFSNQNGYCKFPNGLMLQWGYVGRSPEGQSILYFPTSFSASAWVVVPAVINVDKAAFTFTISCIGTAASSATIFKTYQTGLASEPYYWIAIGKWK